MGPEKLKLKSKMDKIKSNDFKVKRYFINNYIKSKFSLCKIYGSPKCFFCGFDKILDLHHIYSYKKDDDPNPWSGRNLVQEKVDKVIFICPNHHYLYHRLINTQWVFRDFFEKNYPRLMFDLDLIKKRLIELEKQEIPYYKKAVIESGRIGDIMMNDRILKRYGKKEAKKILNKKGSVATFKAGFGERYPFREQVEWFDEETLKKVPSCFICGYKIILDAHHVHKDKKIIFLCPNHHYMIHRHLGDREGTLYTLSEIMNRIKKIESTSEPHFEEVTFDGYQNYKGYNVMKIKE